MPGQPRAVGVVGFQLLHREKAPLRQGGVHRRARMALGENQPVAVGHGGVGGVHVQNAGIQRGHDFRQGEDRSDVAAPAQVGHFQPVAADQPRQHPGIPRVDGCATEGRVGFFFI